jgi:hypothetical protein
LQAGSLGALALAPASRLAASLAKAAPSPQTLQARILKATLGKSIRFPNCQGDMWQTTWADDDSLYALTDDSTGFNKACDSNFAFHRFTGGPPPNIRGETINCMSEFGKGGELKEDRGSWKATGLISVDGVLYITPCRDYYEGVADRVPNPGHRFMVEQGWDSSIIKSIDHGKTWSPAPKLDHAMFPGIIFSHPFFVQYGKDGQVTKKDDADKYVYAVSNDGTWNNGNWMTMGRVSKGLIERLDPADWEFIHGFDEQNQPIWRPRHDNALYVFRSPGHTSCTGIHYIPGLDLYIMLQWYHPRLEAPWPARWTLTRWELYSAPAPWGSWTMFHTQDFEPQGFYNPSIPSKFISEDGRKFWIFTPGFFGSPEDVYGLNMIPVTLEVQR